MSNYYEKELQQIDVKNLKDFAPSIKVFAMNGQNTKHISLNKDSATALIEWLQKNYINKQN
jgi:hypothetical protein